MLIHSADISLFQKYLQLELDGIRQAVGLKAATNDARPNDNI
jgi:hypothetical protein